MRVKIELQLSYSLTGLFRSIGYLARYFSDINNYIVVLCQILSQIMDRLKWI